MTDLSSINRQLADFIRKSAAAVADDPNAFNKPGMPDREKYLAELNDAADSLDG